MIPSLFQVVARLGMVNFTRGSFLTLFKLVRNRDTSCRDMTIKSHKCSIHDPDLHSEGGGGGDAEPEADQAVGGGHHGEQEPALAVAWLERGHDGEVLEHGERQEERVWSPEIGAGPEAKCGESMKTLRKIHVLRIVKWNGYGLKEIDF